MAAVPGCAAITTFKYALGLPGGLTPGNPPATMIRGIYASTFAADRGRAVRALKPPACRGEGRAERRCGAPVVSSLLLGLSDKLGSFLLPTQSERKEE